MFSLDFQAGFSGWRLEFLPLAKGPAKSGGRRRGDRHGELGGRPWHQRRGRSAQVSRRRFLSAKILRTESDHFNRSEVGLRLDTGTSAMRPVTAHLLACLRGAVPARPDRPSSLGNRKRDVWREGT